MDVSGGAKLFILSNLSQRRMALLSADINNNFDAF